MLGDLPAESQEGEPVLFTLPPPRARTIVIERPVEQSVIVAAVPCAGAQAGRMARRAPWPCRAGAAASARALRARSARSSAQPMAPAPASRPSPAERRLRDGVLGRERQGRCGARRGAAGICDVSVRAALSPEEIEPIKQRMENSFAETMRRPGSAASAIRSALLNGLAGGRPGPTGGLDPPPDRGERERADPGAATGCADGHRCHSQSGRPRRGLRDRRIGRPVTLSVKVCAMTDWFHPARRCLPSAHK